VRLSLLDEDEGETGRFGEKRIRNMC